jgi:hypothetical protein
MVTQKPAKKTKGLKKAKNAATKPLNKSISWGVQN